MKRLNKLSKTRRRGSALAISTMLATAICGCAAQRADLAQFSSLLPTANVAQAQTPIPSDWAGVEQDLLAEHNRVRQNPQSYLPILKAHLNKMNRQGNIPNGCGRNCTLMTQEGRPAVEEAIRFLENQPAVGPLTLSEGIAQAAKAHARSQQDGSFGHAGADGSSPASRVARFAVDNGGVGENIAYGPTTAQEVVMNLIVDDGVADRGHRINLFQPDWSLAGAGCGPHAGYGSVCVIDYARLPRGAAAADREFTIVNNGTVNLLSLRVAGADLLEEPLAVGQSRKVSLRSGCEVDLNIKMGGNYLPLSWDNLDLCLATLTIDRQNNFKVTY